jgi:mannuronan synthase
MIGFGDIGGRRKRMGWWGWSASAGNARRVPGLWTPRAVFGIALYVGICLVALSLLPAGSWTKDVQSLVAFLGVVGVWRYGWWLTHLMRAQIYQRRTFPAIRARADALWATGWRPERVHILMTTFRERRETAEAVVRGICDEIRSMGRPAIVWIGSAEARDETTLVKHFRLVGGDLDIDIRIIRQQQPGKRVALSLLLRAVGREGLGENDIVALMDGDFILEPGALTRCLPLFALDPALHAVTTDEDVIVIGPRWMQSWLSMRFAQRRIGMQSHAQSGRVLTLTGRFSVFRATHITREAFIRLIEADHLQHWLWGRFRFLSGDDKSTWYGLLQHGVTMLYVPDARGVTIEAIEGSAQRRMVENLRRWSGNVLRNGWRAIELGPRRMPPFIWWCLVDQRISIVTTLLGPMIALVGALQFGWVFLAAYMIFVAVTRLMLALVLFAYSPRVDLNYVWCLYVNQLVNAGVKLYMLWRLPQQRWANRGNQQAGQQAGQRGVGLLARFQNGMAVYLTTLSVATVVLIATSLTGALPAPRWGMVFLFEDWLR